ncbi:MAG: alpha-L-fucosidase [Lentisphaerae bacterium]|nr:alpha-L-fucosidase [Lentisphaerota bacterium]
MAKTARSAVSSDIRPTQGDSSWFMNDRFGMFIHWGIYALPARHEWVKQYEQIPDADYDKYFRHFDPDLYNPELWAAAAAGAGMKYFVITTKHHDGFCLWDSKLTDYKSVNTPAGRDLIRPMVDAFRGKGLKAGFYHSLIDWHHPEFPIDDMHSMRGHADREKLNRPRRISRYADYLHGQVRELLSEYGKIDVLWLDFSYPSGKGGRAKSWVGKGHTDWQSEKLLKMVRGLQPHILVDDRLDLDEGWDFKTPEQFQVRGWVKVKGRRVVWEACQTFSGSWGYHRDEATWKSVELLLLMLVDSVAKGGNLLLNVGPTGRGEFDERALSRLAGMGEWMKRHSRSIYGCTQAPAGFKAPQDCRLTYNPEKKRLYVHVFAWPFVELHLDGFAGRVEYAQFLHDASEVKFHKRHDWQAALEGKDAGQPLTLSLPVTKPPVTVPVIELFLK